MKLQIGFGAVKKYLNEKKGGLIGHRMNYLVKFFKNSIIKLDVGDTKTVRHGYGLNRSEFIRLWKQFFIYHHHVYVLHNSIEVIKCLLIAIL